jgi:GST-like protein
LPSISPGEKPSRSSSTGEPRYRAIEWLMWQMGGEGPMLSQVRA